MKTRLASLVFAAVSAFAIAGCSSNSSSNEDAPTEDALAGSSTSTQTVKGSFTVTIDRHKLAFNYQLGSLDFERRTAKWNAQLTDRGGMNDATDDVNIVSKITSVARCPGCFSVEVPGGSRADALAVVQVDDWKVTSLVYEGQTATLGTASASGPSTGGGSGSPDDIGACTQECSGDVSCKPNVRRSECASGTGLFPVYRCPTSYTFVKGGTCSR